VSTGVDPAGALYRAGLQKWEEHDPRRAFELWEEGLRISPSDTRLLAVLTQNLSNLGHHEEAVRYGTECVRLNPTDKVTHIWLADSLLELGRSEQAIAEYRIAGSILPWTGGPISGLAEALRRAGRFEEAKAAYEEWFAHAPNNRERCVGYAAVLVELGENMETALEILRLVAGSPLGPRAKREEAKRILARIEPSSGWTGAAQAGPLGLWEWWRSLRRGRR
jgi:tetratricopeptide (TPR) repeat protein